MEAGKGGFPSSDVSLQSSPRSVRLALSCRNSPLRREAFAALAERSLKSPRTEPTTAPKLLSSRSSGKILSPRLLIEVSTPLEPRIHSFRSATNHTKFTLLPLLAELKNHSGPPTRTFARTVTKALETIAGEKGVYEEEMKRVIEAVDKIAYTRRTDIPQWVFTEDVDALVEEDGRVPYFTVVTQLYSEVQRLRHHISDEAQKSSQAAAAAERSLQSKSAEIASLQHELTHLRVTRAPLEQELQEAQQLTQHLTAELETMREQLGRVSEKYRTYKHALTEDFAQIAGLQKKLQAMQKSSQENESTYRALADDHKQICEAYNQLRDNYDNIAEKLTQTLKRNERLLVDLRTAEDEAIRLRERAAAGFEELTPRGSFSEVYRSLGLEDCHKSTKQHLADLPQQIYALRAKADARSKDSQLKRQTSA